MRTLLISDVWGIHIPRQFYESFDFANWGLDRDEYADLSSPENEGYWDTWQDVLDNAEYMENGRTYRLEQDGDLWAIDVELDGWEIVSERELMEIFDEGMADCFGDVVIIGYSYSAIKALKAVDPIAYRQEFLVWLDANVSDEMFKEYDGEYYKEKI